MAETTTDGGWKMADILVKIAVPVLLGLVGALGALLGWGYNSLSDENRDLQTVMAAQQETLARANSRLDVIEATRYTPADAAKVTDTLGKVLVGLARIEESNKATQGKLTRLGEDVGEVAKALRTHTERGSHPEADRRLNGHDSDLRDVIDRLRSLEKPK